MNRVRTTFDANALQRGVVDECPHAEVARHVFVLGDLNNLPVAAQNKPNTTTAGQKAATSAIACSIY